MKTTGWFNLRSCCWFYIVEILQNLWYMLYQDVPNLILWLIKQPNNLTSNWVTSIYVTITFPKCCTLLSTLSYSAAQHELHAMFFPKFMCTTQVFTMDKKLKHYLRGFGLVKKLLLVILCGKWSWNINNMTVRFNIQFSYDTRLEVFKIIKFSICKPDCQQ